MAKTQAEVVEMAARRLGLIAVGESLDSETDAVGDEVLEPLFEELQGAQGLTITWTLSTVPEAAYLPLAYLLAVELAPQIPTQPVETYSRAMGRFRAAVLSDDRELRADLDDSGTVDTDEAEADQRAQYY